jgi:hypothetical protein
VGDGVSTATKAFRRVHNRVSDELKTLPVGTAVVVLKDDGTELQTVTRGEPWKMCGTWMVAVLGISGCYALCRIKKVKA